MVELFAYRVVLGLFALWAAGWVIVWLRQSHVRRALARQHVPAKPAFDMRVTGRGREIGRFNGRPIFDRVFVMVHADGGRRLTGELVFDGVVQPGVRIDDLMSSMPVEDGHLSMSIIRRGVRYTGTVVLPSAPC